MCNCLFTNTGLCNCSKKSRLIIIPGINMIEYTYFSSAGIGNIPAREIWNYLSSKGAKIINEE